MLSTKIRIRHTLMSYLTRVSWVLILFILFYFNQTFFTDGVVSSEEAKNATLETVERAESDTVILKFSDGSVSRHRLSDWKEVTQEFVSPSPKDKMIVPIENFDKLVNNAPNAQEIIDADYKALYKSDKLIVISTKKKRLVSLKLYRLKDLKILKSSNIMIGEDFCIECAIHNKRDIGIELQLSEHQKYLLLSFSDVPECLSYILDANSFKVIDEVRSRFPPSFEYGGERLSYEDGCICEGEDSRVLTVRSISKKNLSITLPFAGHDYFRFESDFFWAVDCTGVFTWDLQTLKFHKHLKGGCDNIGYYSTIDILPMDPDLFDLILVNKDTGYLACGYDSHLRLFRLTDTKSTLLIDKPVHSLYAVFVLREKNKVVGINRKGRFTIVPFKGY